MAKRNRDHEYALHRLKNTGDLSLYIHQRFEANPGAEHLTYFLEPGYDYDFDKLIGDSNHPMGFYKENPKIVYFLRSRETAPPEWTSTTQAHATAWKPNRDKLR